MSCSTVALSHSSPSGRVMFVAFYEVELKPNFDLWVSKGGFPVHGYMLKKSTLLLGHQNGHPAGVLQGHVTASKLVLLLRRDEFVSVRAGHM